jgi:hypothetical protein
MKAIPDSAFLLKTTEEDADWVNTLIASSMLYNNGLSKFHFTILIGPL